MFSEGCVLLALVLVTSAVPLTFQTHQIEETWKLYKSTHKKSYSGPIEVARKLIFHENLNRINAHNIEADLGKHTYWLGINEYADWSNQEFRAFMNGFRKSQNYTSTGSTFLPPQNMDSLPTEVDWREQGYVTPVKNQKACGSCWSFSATGSLEGQHFRKTGKLVSLSEQNLVDCSVPEGDHGCNGGLMDFAFKYVKENGGIDTEQCYPYEAQELQCRYQPTCNSAQCTGYTDIPHGEESALQQALATVGPISVAIDAAHPSFQLYKHGVYNEPQCSSTQLDHGVLAVGYGTDQSGKDFWLVKNSWGPTWGMDGYIKMSRNANNQCGIASSASYPLV